MVVDKEPGGAAAATPAAPDPGISGSHHHTSAMPQPATLGQTLKNGAHKVYKRVFLELILREKPLRPSKDGRHIPLDPAREKPLVDPRRGDDYIDNSVRTSRYTVFDFFPKQLIFQFSRIGNFYFLCVGVPQTIPGLSTTGNYTTILPLMFFVLLTMAKEGFDDYRRHRLDNVENANAAMVLKEASKAEAHAVVVKQRGDRFPFLSKKTKEPVRDFGEEFDGFKWISTKWSDIKVGDVIKMTRDEQVAADIVLLHADGEDNLAYIETMALDGETNLKSKQVSSAIKDCDSIEGILSCPAQFVAEDPNPELYRFDGRVTSGEKTLPITLNEVIYRGSILRNTPSITGLVINTGEESKFRMFRLSSPRNHPPNPLTYRRHEREPAPESQEAGPRAGRKQDRRHPRHLRRRSLRGLVHGLRRLAKVRRAKQLVPRGREGPVPPNHHRVHHPVQQRHPPGVVRESGDCQDWPAHHAQLGHWDVRRGDRHPGEV